MFFGIPPEIRNRIYHYALVEEGVFISRDLKPPGLLSTNRQVRSEAIKIWYLANDFEIHVNNCDASLYRAYLHNVIKPMGHGLSAAFEERLIVGLAEANWEKLKEWCRMVWRGELIYREIEDDDVGDLWAVVSTALTIAGGSRMLPWDVVERQLRGLRYVAGRVDEAWVDQEG